MQLLEDKEAKRSRKWLQGQLCSRNISLDVAAATVLLGLNGMLGLAVQV